MSDCASTGTTMRRAEPAQAEFLTELAIRSKAHWGYSKEFMTACRDELTYTADQIEAPQSAFFVCMMGDRIIGFHALEKLHPDVAELEALFVDPPYIGRGIGRALIEHALDIARRIGVSSVVIQGDPNAERFYLAAGATRTGDRESNSIPGRQLPMFRIELNR